MGGAQGDRRGGAPPLQWRIELLDGKPVQTASGQLVAVDGPINARAAADAVIVTGPFIGNIESFFENPDRLKPLFAALRRQHERGALLASYCTGSFILAEAGLLDGGVATTHWAQAKTFASVTRSRSAGLRNPDRAEPYPVQRRGDHLAQSRAAAGREICRARGRRRDRQDDADRHQPRLAVSYASLPDAPGHSDALVARAQRWMEKSLKEGFSLAELARHLAVSERTLNRRFKLATGEAPLHYLQSLRVDVAKRLLATTGLSVDAVSARVGYSDLSTFRRLFRRETGLSPRDYQRRFSRRPRRARRPAAARRRAKRCVRFASKDGDTATIGGDTDP